MAFIQKAVPPPNRIHTFSLKDFSGGLNNNADLLESNQATNVRNMKFTNDTVMEKRFGVDYFDESLYDGEITFIDEFNTYTDGNKFVVGTKTSLYVDNIKLMNVYGSIRGTTYNGKYYFVDGNGLYVYGKFPQDESDYVKVIGTKVDEYVIFQVQSPPDNYTPLPIEHARGKEVYDYTNKKVWYEPAKLELEDPYKNGNVIPKNAKYIVAYNNRIYVSGDKDDDDNVFISDVQQPYFFPASLPLQPTPNNDKVVGLFIYDNSVFVGRNSDIYAIDGETNNPELGMAMFKLRKINTHTGFANQSTVCLAHNFMFFLGSDGVAYAMGTSRMDARFVHTQIISQQLNLFKEPFNFTYDDLLESTSVFHKDEWYLSIKDLVLVYNYRLRSWTVYDSHDSRYFYRLNNELVWGNSEGRLVHYVENFLDFGKPFECSWSSMWFDMGDANAFKQFREFFIVAHTYDDINSDIRIKFEIDYVDVKSEVLITNSISVWGRAVFGDRFITRNINASAPFVLGRRGRQVRITLKNGFIPRTTVNLIYDLQYIPEIFINYLAFVNEDNSYYLYTDSGWERQSDYDLDQRMKVYQINGEYEFRGKR